MGQKEIKIPSVDGLVKAKKDFENLYKKKPSGKIMEILTEDEISEAPKKSFIPDNFFTEKFKRKRFK